MMPKYFLVPIFLFSFAIPVYADNTHSIDIERSSSQYLSVSSDLGIFTAPSHFTLECWVRPEVSDGFNKTCLSVSDADTNVAYSIYFDDGNVTFKREKLGVGSSVIQWATSLSADTWIHLVGTYDGTNLRLYSAPVAGSHTLRAGPTSVSGNGTSGGSDALYIGYALTTGGETYFDGLIDDVRVWNDDLSITDLDNNFDSELCGNETFLAGYWKLNNDLSDEVGSNDLTNNGSAVFSTELPFTTDGCSGSPPATETSTSTATSTEAILINGFLSIVFGIAIIIFLLTLFVTGYLYNNLIKPFYE